MTDGLYVGLSGLLAQEKRLATLADNIANATTPGFRAASVRFEALVDSRKARDVAFVTGGEDYYSARTGELKATGNPLDLAIAGDAWFGVDTPAGAVLTRDGRFKTDPAGMLVSLDGHPVLDPGGAPIQLNPGGGAPTIAADGVVRQDGRIAGSVGLFAYTPAAASVRAGGSGFLAGSGLDPVTDRSDVSVVQGFVEGSNVNAVTELARLIAVQRAFESASALVSERGSAIDQAIRAMDTR